jgi:hypothetical protein
MPKKIGNRTVTVTCLGTMSNEEALDILATYIAKRIYKKRHQDNSKKDV